MLCLYGWYEWLRGGPDQRRARASRARRRWRWSCSAPSGVAGAVLLGLALARHTDASLPFWDSSTTSFSLVAQCHADPQVDRELDRLDRGGRGVRRDVRLQGALPDGRALRSSSSSSPSLGLARVAAVAGGDAPRPDGRRSGAVRGRPDRSRTGKTTLAARAGRALRHVVVARVRPRATSSARDAARRSRDVDPIARGQIGRARTRRPAAPRGCVVQGHGPPEHGRLQPPLLRRLPGVGRAARPGTVGPTSTCCSTPTCPGFPTPLATAASSARRSTRSSRRTLAEVPGGLPRDRRSGPGRSARG